MSTKNQAIEDRLSQLWQEGTLEIAINFLKRAVHPELSLAELEAILRFDAVSKELSNIRLRDILAPSLRPAKPETVSERRPAAAAPAATRRQAGARRSPEQTEGMKRLLLSVLENKPSGYTTPQLCQKLEKDGFKADAPTATLLLRSMEASGELQSDNGRPKTWTLKSAGRKGAAPMIIRKGGSGEAE